MVDGVGRTKTEVSDVSSIVSTSGMAVLEVNISSRVELEGFTTVSGIKGDAVGIEVCSVTLAPGTNVVEVTSGKVEVISARVEVISDGV